MADEDTVAEKYEPLSAERAAAFVEYEKAAHRALSRLRVDRNPPSTTARARPG
jgi:hypothetical protein